MEKITNLVKSVAPILGIGFFLMSSASADPGITLSNATDINSKILCPIAIAMFWILLTLSTIMVLYGGFLYLTGGTIPERVSKAHKTLIYAAVGIVVALIAGALPTVIANLFGVSGVNICS